MKNTLPVVTRHYQSALIESERWNGFKVRDDDIIITTSYKAGTTWMQAICAALVFQQPKPPVPQDALSPWLDANFAPIDIILELLESLENRRYIKTHLPLTACRFFSEAKYIYVGRDGKDVWMSMWNHWHNMKPEGIAELNDAPDRKGPPLLLPGDDVNEAFENWLTKGNFPWESDGFPFWSHLEHARSWFEHRDLPNIHFVHYQDLLADIDKKMREISAYLDIPVDESVWSSLVEGVSFASMKENAVHMAPGGTQDSWKDTTNFFHQGKNKRWDGVLAPELIARYDAMAIDALGSKLARWLEYGGDID